MGVKYPKLKLVFGLYLFSISLWLLGGPPLQCFVTKSAEAPPWLCVQSSLGSQASKLCPPGALLQGKYLSKCCVSTMVLVSGQGHKFWCRNPEARVTGVSFRGFAFGSVCARLCLQVRAGCGEPWCWTVAHHPSQSRCSEPAVSIPYVNKPSAIWQGRGRGAELWTGGPVAQKCRLLV